MLKKISSKIIMAIFAALTLLQVQAKTDPLWQKAVNLSLASDNVFARTMTETEIIKDEKGKQTEKTISQYSIKPLGQKGAKAVLQQSNKNGTNYTAAKKRELKEMADTGELLDIDNLFHPMAQAQIQTKRLDGYKDINGIKCAVFKFSHNTSYGFMQGKAYLNAKNGAPVKTEEIPAKIPEADDELTINSIHTTTWYKLTPKGHLRIQKILTVTDFEVAGFMFTKYKGQQESILTFSNYR